MKRMLGTLCLILALATPAAGQVTSLTYKDFLPSSRGGSVRRVLLDPGTVGDNAVCRWDGTGGMATQSSVLTVSDLGAIAGTATLGGNVAFLTGEYAAGTTGLIFEGTTADAVEGLLTAADPTSTDRTWTLPDATGTVALTTGYPATATFSAAAGASNVAEVTITIKDQSGVTVAAVGHMDVWLSDSATCAGLTGTTASGTVQAKAASGVDLVAYTAKKSLHVQTLATGIYVLEITDSAKTGFYVCAAPAGKGRSLRAARDGELRSVAAAMAKVFWIEPTGEKRVTATEQGTSSAPLYGFPGGGQGTIQESPVGAMWHASWLPTEWWGEDGIALMVKTPGGEWFVDGRASNCPLRDEWERREGDSVYVAKPRHRCWVRHGDPRAGLLTVDKVGITCSAGAGSIQCGTYHGFLRDGHLT